MLVRTADTRPLHFRPLLILARGIDRRSRKRNDPGAGERPGPFWDVPAGQMARIGKAAKTEIVPASLSAGWKPLAAYAATAPIRKSSMRFPDLSCLLSQRGCFPRPAHVSDGSSGFLNFGETGGYARRSGATVA